MDNLSMSSRHISESIVDSERDKLVAAPETHKVHSEMTLMRLKRLSRTVMCKSERHRFEARRLQRSNIVKFLEDHLMHSSEKVRYLALELLCCTIPRLANKTDSLLKPLLPKVFQCLVKNEHKEMKLKALHFLRAFFRHTKSLSGFIENFVKLGIENPDNEIQISCCLGLNIVFDQDIGNSLYSPLVVSVANLLVQRNKLDLTRAAYRALKHIHKTIRNRFCDLVSMSHPEAAELYNNIYYFEETDSFLSTEDTDCSVIVFEYQMKRNYFNLSKDFGILDPSLLHQIGKTRNCERARAVGNFAAALKRTPWTEDDLDPHILDFLKITNSFVRDSNRLVQMNGLDILKLVVGRMGFALSPQIYSVTEILQQALTSGNSKIRSKADRVMYKLMRNIHPMTVIWNLLNTKDASLKETVLILIQNKLTHFPYHEIDMVALCNCLGQNLEVANSKLARYSRDCLILLLDIMRNCPAYGIRTEAVRVLLRNHKLDIQTLEDIGITGNNEDRDDYPESFESYSDEETTDIDSSSIPMGSSVTGLSSATSRRSMSTAEESEMKCNDAFSDLSVCKSYKTLCESISCCHLNRKSGLIGDEELNKEEKSDTALDLQSQRTIQTVINWQENLIAPEDKPLKEFSAESPDASSVNEQISFSGTDSIPSRYLCSASSDNNEPSISKQEWDDFASPDCTKSSHDESTLIGEEPDSGIITICDATPKKRAPEKPNTSHEKYFIEDESGISQFASVIVSENVDVLQKINAGKNKPRKYFTRFCVKSDATNLPPADSRQYAGGDDNLYSKNIQCNLPQETKAKLEQNASQTGTRETSVFNFNVAPVEMGAKPREGVKEFDHGVKTEVECRKRNTSLNRKREKAVSANKSDTPRTVKDDQESRVPKTKAPKHKSVQTRCVETPPPGFPAVDVLETPPTRTNVTSRSRVTKSRVVVVPRQTRASDFESANEWISDHEVPHLELPTENDHGSSQEEEDYAVQTDAFPEEEQRLDECCADIADAEGCEGNLLLEVETGASAAYDYSTDFEEVETPFKPKNRQLPRTPVEKKKVEYSLEVQPKQLPKNRRRQPRSNKKKAAMEKNREKKEGGSTDRCEEPGKKPVKSPNGTDVKTGGTFNIVKHNSSLSWGGCQWRRDLEYAAKAVPCPWADQFEKIVESMKPFPAPETAETEMKKAYDDLKVGSWKEKETAMLTLIRLAKYHPEVVHENASRIVLALSSEIKNFRQSVAGKAILATGHLYESMGKNFDNKLRLTVAALLAKSGNRTLAAYFRLVIKSLFKITNSTSPQKAAMAFIHEGSRHANKTARETAAQFLTILTENLGPENSLTVNLGGQMLKCAATFVVDSSALTRYCGKRMFKVFMNNFEFNKLKEQQLDINTLQDLTKILAQIESNGVSEEVLPINIINS